MDNCDIKKWKVNLNEYIRVKLNDKGKDIYYHQYDLLNEMVTYCRDELWQMTEWHFCPNCGADMRKEGD